MGRRIHSQCATRSMGVIESIALKPLIMSSSYTVFGFEINNRRFAVKIPKLKIRTPKMLMKRKGRKTPAVKPQEHDLRLKELNTRYNGFLTVKRENNRFGSESSETSGSSSSSIDVEMNESNKSRHANEVSDNYDNAIDDETTSCSYNYENFQLSSTPVSFSLEQFSENRKVIVLKDVSGVKIYEDIFPEESEELISFLEESGATVYEEVDNSAPIYENLDNLSSIVL